MRLRRPRPLAGIHHEIAYEPELVPPPALMRTEGIEVLEEWFRWAEEWSMLLRVFGRIRRDSAVLEIGCGLGRVAFPLRYVLGPEGTYDGFEIVRQKVDFLQRAFTPAHPNFRFAWADVHNTHYNPSGRVVVGVVHVCPCEAEVGVRWREGALQEIDLLPDDLEAVVGALGAQDVAKRERDATEPAADLKHRRIAPDAAEDPEQHAPLLGPSEPLLQDLDALRAHERGRRHELGLVRDLMVDPGERSRAAESHPAPRS